MSEISIMSAHRPLNEMNPIYLLKILKPLTRSFIMLANWKQNTSASVKQSVSLTKKTTLSICVKKKIKIY